MAGFEVRSAYVSISGGHISSQNSKGVVAVASPNQEIVRDDVHRVIEAARALSLPADREIIHIVPREFKVDSQEGIKDPVGMTGVRLESEAHIITSMSTALRNIEKCLHDVGLNIDGFVFSGLAASEVVLTETEKELGVVAVEIGAGSTSLCAFVEGSLAYSAALPIGARHITQDIALGCRISLDAAEKIKLALSNDPDVNLIPNPGESKEEFNKRKKKLDQLDLNALGIDEKTDVLSKRALVEGIMVPRMKEIFTMIGQHLSAKDLLPQVPAGLVLSGGGAETIGMTEVAKRTLNIPARVGRPTELLGLIHDIQKPSFATAIGLLEYGRKHGASRVTTTHFSMKGIVGSMKPDQFMDKLIKMIKSFIP
jgi:cell division protein FtsA